MSKTNKTEKKHKVNTTAIEPKKTTQVVEKKPAYNPKPMISLTDEQKAELPRLGAYLTYTDIADYFMISRACFISILSRDPEARSLYQQGKVAKKLEYCEKLEEKRNDTNSKIDLGAVIFFLKTQGKWSERYDNNEATLFDNLDVSEEEKKELLLDVKLFSLFRREKHKMLLEDK